MTTAKDPSPEANDLISKVQADPSNWSVRKQAALKLYEEGCFLEAADTIWNVADMPSTDVDVAFAVKIVSRARPNRAIRLVYEVLRRNAGKGEKNMAMAKAFSLIGLPMLGSRFYGAAMASNAKYFDIGFESQSLWFDESGALLDSWEKSGQDVKPPFARELKVFAAGSINLSDLEEDVSAGSLSKPASATKASTLKPAVPNAGSPSAAPSAPLASPAPARPASAPVPVTPVDAPDFPEKSKPKPMLPPISNPEGA